jgi:SAM-dependent methyltransferase
LHFRRDKERVVQAIKKYLRPGGRFVLVEYNVDEGNPWVPYPLSYETWQLLAPQCGLAGTQLLATVPSHFLREIYSAVSRSP